MTAYALRRSREAMAADDFPEQLGELLAFAGSRPWPEGHAFSHVRAAPCGRAAAADLPARLERLLGPLAAAAGLGFAFAAQINPEMAVDALRLYRDEFRPSDESRRALRDPLARDRLRRRRRVAHRIAAPSRVAFRRLRAGRPTPLPTVEEAIAEEGPRPSRRVRARPSG